MSKNKKIIEIDVDGVLADMDGAYEKYVKHLIPDFSEEKYVTDWNMPKVEKEYPEAYRIVRSLYSNPEFIGNLERFPKVVEGFQKLDKYVGNKADFVVHTHIIEEGEPSKSREDWLVNLRNDSKVDFKIDICTGINKKTRDGSFVVIEDNVTNLRKSTAPYKFLIRRCHNRKYGKESLGKYKEAYVCNSFYDCADIIKDIFDKTEGVTNDES